MAYKALKLSTPREASDELIFVQVSVCGLPVPWLCMRIENPPSLNYVG